MKIKTASTLSLAAALVSGVSCQRVLQEVAEIGFDISPSGATSGDEGTGSSTAAGTADLLIAALEGDEQVSGKEDTHICSIGGRVLRVALFG